MVAWLVSWVGWGAGGIMVLILRYVLHGCPWPGSSAKPGLPLAASAAASGPPINHSQLPQQPAPPPLPPSLPPLPTQSQSRNLRREGGREGEMEIGRGWKTARKDVREWKREG